MFADLEQRFADLEVRLPSFESLARSFLLDTLDVQWKDHLLAMDHLKEGIGLRGYGQRDPKMEYQREGFDLFVDMNARIRSHAVERLFKVVIETPSEERILAMRAAEEARHRQMAERLREQHASSPGVRDDGGSRTVVREGEKVGRNQPCPCGSGKKYKKCHGAAA
jgi:preprotein translocase subunit SecA